MTMRRVRTSRPGHPGRAASLWLAVAAGVVLTSAGARPAGTAAPWLQETRQAGSVGDSGRPAAEAGLAAEAGFAPDTAAAIHLLRRATFGVRSGDIARVLSMGREAWLEEQLHPERIDDSGLADRLTRFPAARMDQAELYARFPPARLLRARTVDWDSLSQSERRERMRDLGVQGPGRMIFDLAGAKLQRAVYSNRQLEEVMTDFWFNHFNVFLLKGADRWLVADYERSAIRPHVFGRFEDMLVATASHPAMLIYLDNWQSSVPDSLNPAAPRLNDARRRLARLTPRQRDWLVRSGRISRQQLERMRQAADRTRSRKRGINENYARELMELHTLGVDGGYTQTDVIEVARAFTGWTLTRPRPGGERRRPGPGERRPDTGDASMRMGTEGVIEFRFQPELHDTGAKTVLGGRLPAGRGIEDGREVLHILARHPATARHIATVLAQAFVSDEPPSELVDGLADVFLRTGGDLREVTRALFTSQAFNDPATFGGKLKSPFQLVASALRASGADVGPSRRLVQNLRELGQLPYLSPVPTGYPRESRDWSGGGALLQRMNFGLVLAAGRLDHVKVPVPEQARGQPERWVPELVRSILPGMPTRALEEAILADLPAPEPWRRALGLALGSPEFQRL
ncbi:MAG: DUF1800 domain-containing protein [Gemmatimonadota bacterium]